MPLPSISVVIAVYNGGRTLGDCLRAIMASDYAPHEVVVVDDGSTDDTQAIAGTFPCRLIPMNGNCGAAAARNAGARAATGDIVLFIDADVVVMPATLRDIAGSFVDRPDISALFGSYRHDTRPGNFCSQYKNLIHHYTHQTAQEDAATFWTGAGAIRREVFLREGGFDESYRAIEDIELGYRMYLARHRILLNKNVQVTHLKRYTLKSLVRSDVFSRAIPWTRLMLDTGIVRNDLNSRTSNVLSMILSAGVLMNLVLMMFGYAVALPNIMVLLLVLLALNWGFFRFVHRRKGMVFTLQAIVMQWFVYVYSLFGVAVGWTWWLCANLKMALSYENA